jgi:hypothetical protein
MKYGDPLGVAPEKPHNTCVVECCNAPARNKSAKLCKKHYHREYRHGDLEADFRTIKTAPTETYISEYNPQHPLASRQGKVYVHRRVLYGMIGDGPHECHWCRCKVNWSLVMGAPDYLQVDHLDENKRNNKPENLVPACGRCNPTRSTQKRHEVVRALGGWAKNDTLAALKNADLRRSTMAFSA